jgi:hypothetical protein
MWANNTKTVNCFCKLPFNRVKVGSDGNINMCCHQSAGSCLGNLFTHAFEDMWFGPFAEEIRDATRSARLHRVCDTMECSYKHVRLADFVAAHPANANGYPTELEFDLHGSHCNYGGTNPTPQTACIMCPRSRPDFKDHLAAVPDRTDELLGKVLHIVRWLKVVNVLGIAEPFWKDKLFDMLGKFGFPANRDRIEVWTTTNGSVFTPDRQDRFAELVGASMIHFSIDAATPETYRKIRQHDYYDKVCDNVRRWCGVRDRAARDGTGRHVVKIHNNINTLNVHEAPAMVRAAKSLGADMLVMLPTHDCGGTHDDLKPLLVSEANCNVFAAAQRDAQRVADEVGQRLVFSRPLALGLDRRPLVQLGLPARG